MQWFAALPIQWRYVILGVTGLVLGGFANYLIYWRCYFPRHISPWAPPHPDAPPRNGLDRLPLVGWWGLRRESPLHGRFFWLRPLLVELGTAFGLVALYWFETQSGRLLPEAFRAAPLVAGFGQWAHSLYAVHAVIFVLMVAATFIDFDEQTIPDAITVPGTLFALMASALPWQTLLPSEVNWNNQVGIVETGFNIPWPFEASWFGGKALVIAVGLWSGWCFALADRHVVPRHGFVRAAGYLWHGMRRNPQSKYLLLLWGIGLMAIVGVWFSGDWAWRGLLTSLVGLGAGGGTVWAVRIVASYAMGQEAIGFGDVTLMAMIGAAVGWQCAVAAFFIAPFAALAIVLIQYMVTREPMVPFGPYLCAGTCIAVVGWNVIWNQTLSQYVAMGMLLLYFLIGSLLMMGVMLAALAQVKRMLRQ